MSVANVKPLRLLYLTAEQWPTFRPDVVALFGKYLPRHGITSDLVTERDCSAASDDNIPWAAGQARLCTVPRNRAAQYVCKLWHNLRVLATLDSNSYDAIQVRDMSLTALAALIVARMRGLRFFYWLSYPQSEGQIERARARGIKGGMRYWFPLLQGSLGKWLLYRVVLPCADHVFVQSRQMQRDVALQGIPMQLMTPVPIGVDSELACAAEIVPVADAALAGKRVVIYLGSLDPLRQIDILLHMLVQVRDAVPDILLVIVGDTGDEAHRAWLKQEAQRLGVAGQVLWTGWLDSALAWRYVRAAEIGLSPIPRGYLLDMASPTKAVEYMAFGLPVVVNDNPDQAEVIAASGAGLCVTLDPHLFAAAVIRLLGDDCLRKNMGAAGMAYVAQHRTYGMLASALAATYTRLLAVRRA